MGVAEDIERRPGAGVLAGTAACLFGGGSRLIHCPGWLLSPWLATPSVTTNFSIIHPLQVTPSPRLVTPSPWLATPSVTTNLSIIHPRQVTPVLTVLTVTHCPLLSSNVLNCLSLSPAVFHFHCLPLSATLDNFGSALGLAVNHLGILLHRERAVCRRLPDVLLVIVVLADDAGPKQ